MPLAILCARRLANTGLPVVLATSTDTTDDLLASKAENAGVPVFRGSLDRVIDRYVGCTEDMDRDAAVVRVTADNPLPDGAFISILIEHFHQRSVDYLGTSWPNAGLPYGMSAEIFTVGSLRDVAASSNDCMDHEHVTFTLSERSGRTGMIEKGAFVTGDYSHFRATIDTLEDYLAMAALFEDTEVPVTADWKTMLPDLPEMPRARTSPAPSKDTNESSGNIMLGTVQLGLTYGITNQTGMPNDTEVANMFSLAHKKGVGWLDTARAYGKAEWRIGHLLPPDSASFKIITKLEPMNTVPDDTGESEINAHVDASVYGSCHDLCREQLDVLMFHRNDDMYRWNGAALRRLHTHLKSGLTQAIGVSVYAVQDAIRALQNDLITHIQIPFNIVDTRWLSGSFISALQARPDVKIHARSVFLQGLLISNADKWPQWFAGREVAVQTLFDLTNRFGRQNRIDLCMSYVRSYSWVSSLVLGSETAAQLDELLSLPRDLPLSRAQRDEAASCFAGIPSRLLNPSEW
jgi:spore coat polysaccharide biosynthesis protein SpsF (cytidylyltransferase family)/aryl-alcohol dehydrogenase-like predicted oxidoreductase